MSRRAAHLAVALAVLVPAVALAQAPGITRSRLPNGMTVVVRENSAAPLVAYSLLVKMGTRTETADNAGISNMLQLMLVRGTEKMSGEEIVSAADRMGGSIDAYADADYSEITASALSRNWQPMLELLADVALRPTIPEGLVPAVRDYLVRQIRNRGEKPYDVAADRMRAALFGSHPYAWDSLGRRESVEQFTRDALVAYYRRYYVPGQMVLAVSGDVKGADVLREVERIFGAIAAGNAEAPKPPAPPVMSATREVFTVPGAQAQIFMAALAPPFTDPDFAALKVTAAILGGGMASRFFSDLRDKQALAYTTFAQYPGRIDTSAFVTILGTAPANVPKAEAALTEQLARIRNEPASEEEVAVARSYVVGNQAMDRRSNARQAWYLAAGELVGVGYQFFDVYAANVKKVTPADVQRVARQYLGVLRTVVVHPP
ncbi:MAG TPA: pitrilysin family protein [Methylomirabilota bacterium]|jgi:predicted Zn-dependent peptidase